MFTIINDSPRIWQGFIPFGLCSCLGVVLILRGVRGNVLDSSGMEVAARGWFIAGGILLQLPLAAFTFYLWRQGLFAA